MIRPLALLPLAAAAMPAAAQEALPDIVVTAEKRDTTVAAAPLALTALPAEQLRAGNVNQVNDLNGLVPGLAVAKSEGAERVIAIRGIGYETAQNPNSQPGVAFHIDGVYVAHVVALNQDLVDVERVEVLRGPQGTVFGETATGGAINVITRRPVLGVAGGEASLSAGSHGYLKATAAADIPLTATLAARVAVQHLSHDGYGRAVAVPGVPRYPLDDADNLAARAVLLWQPDDRLTATLALQGFATDRAAALQKNIADRTPGVRHVAQDFPGTFRMATRLATLTLARRLGEGTVLRSVTAWQGLDKNQTSDNDRLADPGYFDHIVRWRDLSHTWTQELSLASAGRPVLEWTLGGFFLGQHARQTILEAASPAAAALVLPDGTGIKFQTDSPYAHVGLAAYGNATWRLSDLSLLGGLRYNRDRITARPVQLFQPVPPRAAASHAVTGKVGLEYRPAPDAMAYLTASRGYKPNGLNFNAAPLFVPTSYRKEVVDALEAGLKAEPFGRRLRLALAGYHYRYRNFQFTAEDPVPFAGGTDNVPRTRIWGAELEATALPAPGVRVDASAAWARGRFRGRFLTLDAQTAAAVRAASYAALGFPAAYYYDPRVIAAAAAARADVDGNRVPKLPTWTARISPSYRWRVAGGAVTLRGELIHRGGFNYRLFASPALDRVPAYTVANAFLSFAPDRRRWSLGLSALNLGDRAGINSRFSDPYGSGTTSVEYLDPRELFATLSWRW